MMIIINKYTKAITSTIKHISLLCGVSVHCTNLKGKTAHDDGKFNLSSRFDKISKNVYLYIIFDSVCVCWGVRARKYAFV